MKNNNESNNPKRFFNIADIEKALEKKNIGKEKALIHRHRHKQTICPNCDGTVFNISVIGFEYCAEICVNCGRTNRIFRKLPNLHRKQDFLT